MIFLAKLLALLTRPLPGRFRHRPGKRPSFQALAERLRAKPEVEGPICENRPLPRILDPHVISHVSHLLFLRCPSAVAWLVTGVVIYTFNAAPIWARSHIGLEVGERVSPAIADGDSATTILTPSPARTVVASSDHRYPYSVNRWDNATSPSPVAFAARAPTTHGVPTLEASATDNCCCPAITQAVPRGHVLLADMAVKADDGETAEALTFDSGDRFHASESIPGDAEHG